MGWVKSYPDWIQTLSLCENPGCPETLGQPGFVTFHTVSKLGTED